MADNVEVKLGADTGDATSGMKDAATSIAANLASMKDALEKFTAASERTHGAVQKHTQGMSAFFAGFSENVRVRLGRINSAVETFNTRIALLGEIFAGGALFKGVISSMLNFESAVRGLQIVFGTTTEKATELSVALRLAGVSSEAYEGMAFRVGRVLKTQSTEFDRLKVVTKDAAGNLLPMQTILQNVYQRMLDFKAGTDQTMFALSTVGRSAKDFASDMERLASVQQKARDMQAQLNIEMGPARIAEIERYRVQFNAFKIVMEDIATKIGEVVLPRLMALGEFFNSEGPKAAGYFVIAVRSIITAFTIFGSIIGTIGTQVGITVGAIIRHFELLGNAIRALATGDWPGLARAVKSAMENARQFVKESFDHSVDDAAAAVAKIKKLWGEAASSSGFGMGDRGIGASGALPGKGTESFKVKPTGGPTQVEVWKQQLEEIKMAQGYFREYDKAEEAAFWENKLALVKKGSKEYIEIYSLMYQARKAYAQEELAAALATFQREIDAAKDNQAQQMEIAKARTATIAAIFGTESKEYQKALDEEIKLREEWKRKEEAIMRVRTKMIEDAAAHEVAMEEENLKQQVALRNISDDQKFAIEQAFENKLYALKLKALEDEKATLTAGTLAYEQVAAKIEALEQAHQLKLTTIANQAELDRKQAAITAAADIQSAFATFFADLANGTKSVTQAFKDMVKTITADLNKLASEQIAKQLFGPGTTGGGLLNQLTGGIFGGGAAGAGKGADAAAETAHTTAVTADTAATTTQTTTSTLLNTVATTLQAGFTALVAAANAAAAALTSVGASGGAGGAMGGLGGLFGGGSSFGDMFGGFMQSGTPYVPRDMLAFIHKGEAVIPAALNTGTGVGTKNWSMNVHYHLAGPLDRPTQDQAAAHMARVLNRTMQKNM